jgi:choline-sulfatase
MLALALAGCTRNTTTPGGPPPSVLLITVDTLRADRVGAYGDTLARTPSMDALARAGVTFARAFTPAPLTLPAHATLMTGLLPPQHGVRGNGGFALGPDHATLAEALRARGVRTAAFVGGFPLERRFGLARGFDHYDDAFDRAEGIHFDFAERRADRVVEAAQTWLAGQPGPVFVWVHVFDPHAPYDPPPDFRGAPDPYRGEIAFTDLSLGRLLAAWDARPGPSFVALTADHGEAFGEHGEESHSLFVYDTTLRVPLVVRGPGLRAGRRVEAAVGLADLAATIVARVDGGAHLRGSPPPPRLPGRDLLEARDTPHSSKPLYAETLSPRLDFGWSDLRALRDGRYKYVRAPRPELYDVEADPNETVDLSAREPAVRERLSRSLEAMLQRLGDEHALRGPDPEAEERLRSLGYAQGPGGGSSATDPKDKLDVALRIAKATGPFSSHEEAARVYRDIATRDPDNPLVNLRLADAFLRAGRPRESIAPFRRVVAGGPRTVDAHVGLATAYAELGRMGDARNVLEEALRIDPGSGQVQFNLGELSRAAGQVAAARSRYEAALRDPVTAARSQDRLKSLE